MVRYFVVDSIIDNIVRLEEIDNKNIIEVYNFVLPEVSEGDTLVLDKGIFVKDDTYKNNRENIIKDKFEGVKNYE